MPQEYLVEEFLGDDVECTFDEQIDKKVSLLYDLYKLHKKGKSKDSREQIVRQVLSSYTTETQLDNAVRDVVLGKCTLNDFIKRKGYLQ